MRLTLPAHPDHALAAAMRACAALWREHPLEFYAQVHEAWSREQPEQAARMAGADEAIVRIGGSDLLPLRIALVLRQQETQAIAQSLVQCMRVHGATTDEVRATLRALASYVQFAARLGVRGCPLTGPVTVPLIRRTYDRR